MNSPLYLGFSPSTLCRWLLSLNQSMVGIFFPVLNMNYGLNSWSRLCFRTCPGNCWQKYDRNILVLPHQCNCSSLAHDKQSILSNIRSTLSFDIWQHDNMTSITAWHTGSQLLSNDIWHFLALSYRPGELLCIYKIVCISWRKHWFKGKCSQASL